jgi:N utilization substance protein A
LTAPATPLTALAGVGPKTIEKIEAAGITNLEKLAGMTPEQLMEIPGIGEKMVDKIYQAVNRFYESGADAAAAAPAGENTDDMAVEGEVTPAEGETTPENTGAASENAEAAAAEETPEGTLEGTSADGETAAAVQSAEAPAPEHSEGGAKAEEEPKP